MANLSDRDKIRYNRQIMIQNFGEEGQKKLKSTKALVAGAGGLGSPVSVYLAEAGVGSLKIVDNDVVEISNLNRQILYTERDIGENKDTLAGKTLKELNQDINIETVNQEINEESISQLVEDCDLIVDCMDNYPTRYILNETAVEKGIPLFHAAVRGMNGQATTIVPGETPCLRCVVPSPPPPEKSPVLGATAGLLACVQVHEVIKHLIGMGASLKNKLLVVSRGVEFETIEIEKNPECKICGSKK